MTSYSRTVLKEEGKELAKRLESRDIPTLQPIDHTAGPCSAAQHNRVVDTLNASLVLEKDLTDGVRFLVRCNVAQLDGENSSAGDSLSIPILGKKVKTPTSALVWIAIGYLFATSSLGISPLRALKAWLMQEEGRFTQAAEQPAQP